MEFRNWQKAQDLLSDLRHRSGALDAGEHLPPYFLVQFSLSFDLLHPLAGGPSVDGASYSRDRRIFLLLLMGDDLQAVAPQINRRAARQGDALHNSTQPWQTAKYQEGDSNEINLQLRPDQMYDYCQNCERANDHRDASYGSRLGVSTVIKQSPARIRAGSDRCDRSTGSGPTQSHPASADPLADTQEYRRQKDINVRRSA